MATGKSTAPATFEEVVDGIYELIYPVGGGGSIPCETALHALTACIMGTIGRCADPQRALLAVISEVTNLVRFAETRDDEKVVPLEEWVTAAWAE